MSSDALGADKLSGNLTAQLVKRLRDEYEDLDEAVSSSRVHKSDLTPEEPEMF